MPREGRFGDWDRLVDVMERFGERLRANAHKALARGGGELAGMVKERILDGKDMTPLHGFTIEQKGSSKPLMDDGDLLGSVDYAFLDELAVIVGARRKAADGTDLAALHEREDGTRIAVTPKMRAFLHARGFHLKPSTTTIFIPGRPFLKPAARDFEASGMPKELGLDVIEKTVKGEG